jgi:ADP-ribosylation factor-like protein 5B
MCLYVLFGVYLTTLLINHKFFELAISNFIFENSDFSFPFLLSPSSSSFYPSPSPPRRSDSEPPLPGLAGDILPRSTRTPTAASRGSDLRQGVRMGAWMSRVWFVMFPAKEYKIVVVGLDNAGKTTTLYKLHLGEAVTAAPTIGSNVEEVVFKNIRFEVSAPPLLASFLSPDIDARIRVYAARFALAGR